MTQTNLGTALWRLSERESGTARLAEAVTAYRAALKEYTATLIGAASARHTAFFLGHAGLLQAVVKGLERLAD